MQPAKFCHVKGLTLEGSAFLFSFKPLVSSFSGHQTGVASRISIQVPLVCPPADPRLHRHGHRLRNICDATLPALRMPPPSCRTHRTSVYSLPAGAWIREFPRMIPYVPRNHPTSWEASCSRREPLLPVYAGSRGFHVPVLSVTVVYRHPTSGNRAKGTEGCGPKGTRSESGRFSRLWEVRRRIHPALFLCPNGLA